MATEQKQKHWFETFRPYVFGCISACTATSVIQPIDTVKVRIQAINEINSKSAEKISTNPIKVFQKIVAETGPLSLYKGLDAAILRQVMYGTIRLGLFQQMSDSIKHKHNRNLTFGEKAFCSLFSGLVGSIIGNPADLSLVRFQVDTLLPPEERRNYKNVGDALVRMVREEGLFSLWRGCTPTVVRAMSINFGMLASYDEIKERSEKLTGDPDSKLTKCIASALSGVIAATVSLPPDNIKTKMMKMKPDANGVLPYSSFMDCAMKSVKNEGITGLWVGLPTYIVRVGPHAIVALLAQDFLTTWWKNKMKVEGYA